MLKGGRGCGGLDRGSGMRIVGDPTLAVVRSCQMGVGIGRSTGGSGANTFRAAGLSLLSRGSWEVGGIGVMAVASPQQEG